MVSLARKVLCLDWDRRSLRFVVARVGRGRVQLEHAHSVRLGGVNPDEPEAMGSFIKQTLKRHRVSFHKAIVDVPRDRVFIHLLGIPPTPENEVADIVRFQAMKELTFHIDDAELDHVVVARDEQGQATEVLVAAVLKKTLDGLREVVQAAGLKLARVGLRPYANLVSVRHLPEIADKRTLFVDVGPTTTEIDVFCGQALRFSRAASVTVNPPDPSGSLSASADSRILTTADLERSDQALDTSVNTLLVEMTRTIQAFRATDPVAHLDQIVIAGGTGVESELARRAEQRFGYACELFDPTQPLGVAKKESAKLREFSAALGLAWGLSREGLLELDFLNPKRPIPKKKIRIQRARLAGLTAAALAVSAAGYGFLQYQAGARQLQNIKESVASARADLKKQVEIQTRIEELGDWALRASWPDELLRLTDSAVEPGKKMLVQQMTLDNRTAAIAIRQLRANHFDVPTEYERRLNDLNEDGVRRYQAAQGTWRETAKVKADDWQGSVDLRVILRPLLDGLEKRDANERARRQRLRKL